MPQQGRRRDAATSRARLLAAGSTLFAERGFDRATVRDIGQLAGVDPALIARYFGGKTQLYIAALRAEGGDTAAADLLSSGRLGGLLERLSRQGPGPIFHAAVAPADGTPAQQAARAELRIRLIDPLASGMRERGVDQPQLRAEAAVAALVGIVVGSGSGCFPALASAQPAGLGSVVAALLAGAESHLEEGPAG